MNADHQTLTAPPTPNPNWPIGSGWPFVHWLEALNAKLKEDEYVLFLGSADIHRAYDHGGITGACARANVGLDAASKLFYAADPGSQQEELHLHVLNGWTRVYWALLELKETVTG